jgi:hypothetical protein
MKKNEIMSRLFKGGKKGTNDDLLGQINALWEGKDHILHIGFRNNPEGKGQKLTFGFTKESVENADPEDLLSFPLTDTLQVRYTRTQNIVKAPNNRVAVAEYKNMFRDELKETVAILKQIFSEPPSPVEEQFKKDGPVRLDDFLEPK